MVRIADTLKQQNDLTSFPVAYSDGIWLDKNKGVGTADYSDIQTMYNNDELGSGSTIQTDTLPIPSIDELGNIYQFTGSTGTYINGFFYQCVSYSYLAWTDESSNTVYTKNLENAIGGKVYSESGGVYTEIGTITELADDDSTMSYLNSNEDTVDCTRDSSSDVSDAGYVWVEKEVSPSNVRVDNTSIIEDISTHEISVANTYETTKTCTDIDEWNALSPTEKAKYQNVIIEQDETTTPISIVDTVQNGNMYAVTSNAVHDYVQPIKDVIPSNASSSNKLVAKSDVVTKYNYTMVGTASIEDDIKTFVTALIALGANTYVGFFNRSGSLGTAGNYSITIYAEEGTSIFASGYIALGAGAVGKTQYIVSYYKPTGSSEEWVIKKLATTSDTAKRKDVTVTATASIEDDIKTLLDELIVETSGSYIGYFTRTGNTSGYYSVSVNSTWNTVGIVSICGASTNAYRVAKFKSTEQGAYTYQIEKLVTMPEVKTLFTTPLKRLLGVNIPTTFTVDSTYNHLVHIKAQLKDFIPDGYKLYKATLDISWTNGNSYEAYLAEVISSGIAVTTSGENKEAEFTLITRAEQTLGATYSQWNAYGCTIECVKE